MGIDILAWIGVVVIIAALNAARRSRILRPELCLMYLNSGRPQYNWMVSADLRGREKLRLSSLRQMRFPAKDCTVRLTNGLRPHASTPSASEADFHGRHSCI